MFHYWRCFCSVKYVGNEICFELHRLIKPLQTKIWLNMKRLYPGLLCSLIIFKNSLKAVYVFIKTNG